MNIIFLFFMAGLSTSLLSSDIDHKDKEILYFLPPENSVISSIELPAEIKFGEALELIAHKLRFSSANDIFCVSKKGEQLSSFYDFFTLKFFRTIEKHRLTGTSKNEAIIVSSRKHYILNEKYTKQELFEAVKNRRESDEECLEYSVWESPLISYKLTHLADKIIAEKYKKKHLKNDASKFFYISKYKADLLNSMYEFINNPIAEAGFFSMEALPGHVTPLVLIKRNSQWHLFISDSLGWGYYAFKNLDDFCQIHNIARYISVITRQKDRLSCHSDALYYLQRSARLPSFFDAVTIMNPKDSNDLKKIESSKSMNEQLKIITEKTENANFMIFLDCPDLVLTSQCSDHLNEILDEPLMCSKNGKTVNDKLKEYTVDVNYLFCFGSGNQNDVTFKERTFLAYISKKHMYMLEKYLKKDG